MGSVFSKPKMPKPPPPPVAPEPVPTVDDKRVTGAREEIRRRAAVARGRDDDIKTSPLGAPSRAAVNRQSLLGR